MDQSPSAVRRSGETKALAAGMCHVPPVFRREIAAPAEGVLRHSDISGGFQSAGLTVRALPSFNSGRAISKTGKCIGRHIPRQRKLAGAEPSPAVEQVMVLPDGHAVIRQDLIQRIARGAAAAALPCGTRRLLPKRRSAAEETVGWNRFPDCADDRVPWGFWVMGRTVKVLTPKPDLSAQGVETVRSGGNVLWKCPDSGSTVSFWLRAAQISNRWA